MKYNLPSFNEKEERIFIEQKILCFSTELFRNPRLGLFLIVFINVLYLYAYFKSKSVISIILYLFLLYIVFSIVSSKLLNLQKNE